MAKPTTDQDLILIVDDVEENCELAKIYAQKLGWRTLCCDSGKHALNALKSTIPRVILLDIKMPEIDGISLARVIRLAPEHSEIKIIGYTAHALKDEIEYLRTAGFDDVLIKPVTYKSLSDCLGTTNIVFL
jgi:CheY-like chemotaxis protein